jgi:hypothetical protein
MVLNHNHNFSRPGLEAVMRKELVAGDREWLNNIDLKLTKRGFIDVSSTDYSFVKHGQRFSVVRAVDVTRKPRIHY